MKKWNVLLGVGMLSEHAVQQRVRLEAAKHGVHLWRNNVGACIDQNGRMIRYGLANESAQMNKHIKSSDLIGIRPTLITQEMVGMVVGIFVAAECKHEGWEPRPNDVREMAQEKYHSIVRAAGGIAGFTQSVADFHKLVGI
jgi:hypothetical protein